MKQRKTKTQQVKINNRPRSKTNKSSNSCNSANTISTSDISFGLPVRNLATVIEGKRYEIEKRLRNADLREHWLDYYGLELCLLRKQIEDFAEVNNDVGAIFIEYISTDCRDYLPVVKRPTPESDAESFMHVRNNVIEDITYSFIPFQVFQEDLKKFKGERIECLVQLQQLKDSRCEAFQNAVLVKKLGEDIKRLDADIISTKRAIELIKQCDYSIHRVICVLGVEAVLVSLDSLSESIFDEHDMNWVCRFDPEHICVSNLEKCLEFCNCIDEDVDLGLIKEVCVHTGIAIAINSSIEWNPVIAEKLRNYYKDCVTEDGSLFVAFDS